jgi:two-component system, LytTR family, response regulator
MEQKLSALIVDDEESARKLLNKLLEETLFFSKIVEAQSATLANNILNDFEPDIIFLDIKMPGKDGFSFVNDLKQNNQKSGIVFVTAYDQFAIKAIKSRAFDYLLKPVNRKELKQCILRFTEQKKLDELNVKPDKTTESTTKISRIRVNTRTGTLFINPSSILYCKADGNYTSICTGEKQHLCSLNLGKVEDLLKGSRFVRIGRSLIINIEYITLLDRKESAITLVREKEAVILKVPRQHLKDLDII